MKIFLLLVAFSIIVFPSSSFAHPGRTASDGCHYCRTNCDSWGVPWDERHCHNGGAVAPAVEEQPEYILPTLVPTIYVFPTRIVLPTNTPVPPTSTPTPVPTKTPVPKPTKRLIPTIKTTIRKKILPNKKEGTKINKSTNRKTNKKYR